MKILLFGKYGQVGWELNRALLPLGDVVSVDRHEADFSKPEMLGNLIREIRPNVIVNAVAYTAVDMAEDEEDLALLINGTSTKTIAQEAKKLNALLIHYSTDYVFDGKKQSAYSEQDKPNPLSAYGRTKLIGEGHLKASGCEYIIFRTSWVYAPRGKNFLLTIRRLAFEKNEINVVSDQIGAPTSARLIAETSAHCLAHSETARAQGIFCSNTYNLTTSGSTSWYGFSVAILDALKNKRDSKLKLKIINGITTNEYPTKAVRPKNSKLDNSKIEQTFGLKMPDWKTVLLLCLEELT